MGWTPLSTGNGVDNDNNLGGYDGAIPTGDWPHMATDPDGGYGTGTVPGPDNEPQLGPSGELAHSADGDGYSTKLKGNSDIYP